MTKCYSFNLLGHMLWPSSPPDSPAEPEAPQEEVSDEVFNLQCQVNFLTEQLAEASGGALTDATPHRELSRVRQLLASREDDIAKYDERMVALEAENGAAHAQLASALAAGEQSRSVADRERAAAEEARACAAVAAERAAKAQTDAVRDAEDRARAQARTALERENQCVHMLAGALAEAEHEHEQLLRVHSELVSSSARSQQTSSTTLVLGMQERAELERALGEAQREGAHLRGTVGALEVQLASLRPELETARRQAAEGTEHSVSTSLKTGQLEVLLTSREGSLKEAHAAGAAARAAAEAAREQAAQEGARAVGLSRELEEVSARLRAATEEAAAETAALAARTGKAEAEAEAAAARYDSLLGSSTQLSTQQAAALETAGAVRREAGQAAAAAEHELASTRTALASVELQLRTRQAEAERERQKYMDAAKARRDAEVVALQRRLDEAAQRDEAQRLQLEKAGGEAKRGARHERQCRELEARCKALDDQLAKKTSTCERLLKRRSSVGAFAAEPAASCPATPAASAPLSPKPAPRQSPSAMAPSPSDKAPSPGAKPSASPSPSCSTAAPLPLPLPLPAPVSRASLGPQRQPYLTRLQVAVGQENQQTNTSGDKLPAHKHRAPSPVPGSSNMRVPSGGLSSRPASAPKKQTYRVVNSRYASPGMRPPVH